MPTYALLGATGSTGTAIVRALLANPPKDLTLNAFVRSRAKLLKAFPDLETTTAFKVNIIQGTPADVAAMKECLDGVDVIMGCIGSNYTTPGMTLIYDTATAVINTLTLNHKAQGTTYKTPTVIQLRSVSLNPALMASSGSWFVRYVVHFCVYYGYEDLDRACKLFMSSAADTPRLLNYIFVDPPAIHDADGTTPTGYRLIIDEFQKPELSYADLGVAFCEVAEKRAKFSGKEVGVTATGAVKLTWGASLGFLASGAKARLWG